ncbi:MAG: LysR family transcriptional regulator [Pseudomonadota bacterium]
MYNVKALRAFVAVADLGSFAAAADMLRLSTSSVSRLVADLEAWLETPLLRRSTRHMTLTDAGAKYLIRCRAIVAAWDDLEADAKRGIERPSGNLTVAGAIHSVRQMLAPHLPDFLRAYPDIRLNLDLQNDAVDLVADSVDVAFRLGQPRDSAQIAKKLGDVPLMMTAAPGLIEAFGAPRDIDDLARLPCMLDSTPKGPNHWPKPNGKPIDFVFEANDGEVIRQMTLAGIGVSMLPGFLVAQDVAEGRLVRLFPDELRAVLGVYLFLPGRRQIVAPARVFADFMSDRLRRAHSGAGRERS